MSRYSVLLGNTLPSPGTPSLQAEREPVAPVVKTEKETGIKQVLPIQDNNPTGVIVVHQNDGMTARQHDGKLSSHNDSMTAKIQYALHDFLAEKPTEKSTIRTPKILADYIDETLYQIKRKYGVKLSMQAILIVALASFCLEFEEQGSDSPLYKKLIEEINQSVTA